MKIIKIDGVRHISLRQASLASGRTEDYLRREHVHGKLKSYVYLDIGNVRWIKWDDFVRWPVSRTRGGICRNYRGDIVKVKDYIVVNISKNKRKEQKMSGIDNEERSKK